MKLTTKPIKSAVLATAFMIPLLYTMQSQATAKVPTLIECKPGIANLTFCSFSGNLTASKTTDVLTSDDVTPEFQAILGQIKDLQSKVDTQTIKLDGISNKNNDENLKHLVREAVEQILKEKNIN